MPAYLVRTIEEHDLVGVFYASNPLELAFLIDEVLDPDRCEYRKLSRGGVIWEGPAVQIPLPSSNDDDDASSNDIPWKEARFTELWGYDALYKKARWRKIEYTVEDLYGIDPETPDPERPPRPTTSPSRLPGKVLPFRRRL
ncbi:hypothetical protein IVB18_45490 [Bradyrhizobium sp. 186]|uniref:hypothetical protein n=1 Tax=Bradyrhizobium sp. 186 TaxID=2782654 RepID=UPI002001821C|nr:hypothetical protein [Bradyrhizobium sp. 186]UPK35155.1 hypothetical protein IVB18_45490 [Bradyrhizobium sp. 186]